MQTTNPKPFMQSSVFSFSVSFPLFIVKFLECIVCIHCLSFQSLHFVWNHTLKSPQWHPSRYAEWLLLSPLPLMVFLSELNSLWATLPGPFPAPSDSCISFLALLLSVHCGHSSPSGIGPSVFALCFQKFYLCVRCSFSRSGLSTDQSFIFTGFQTFY